MARGPIVPGMDSSSKSSPNFSNSRNKQSLSDPLQLSDSEESLFVSDDELPNRPKQARTIKREPGSEEGLPGWLEMGNQVIELSDDEGPSIKEELHDQVWNFRGELIELDSDYEEEEDVLEKKPANPSIPQCIDLDMDDDNDRAGVKGDRRPTPDGIAPVHAVDSGTCVGVNGKPVIIKHEPKEIPFQWKAIGAISGKESAHKGREVIDLDDPLEMVVSAGRAKRQVVDRGDVLRLQQMCKDRVKGKPEPGERPVANLSLHDDGLEWMHSEAIPDDVDPAAEFRKVKDAYKALKRSRRNKLEDDVQFERARIKESARIKRLAHDAADSDESADEESESEYGLFVPQNHSKRPCPQFDEDSDEDHEIFRLLTGNTGDHTGGNSNQFPKRSKFTQQINSADPVERRAREKKYQKELAKELHHNKMAGIAGILFRDQKRQVDKALRIAANEAKANKPKGRRKKGKTSAERAEIKGIRTTTGNMTNIASLVNSNVYEESNNALKRAQLPVATEKKRKEFLSSMIANVPVGSEKQAITDKNSILRSATLLQPRTCKPDGKGAWSMKGMRSSLYHYQVQGAACMKDRESGDQAPFGGILADAMGLGKTVMTIAAMVANRQQNPYEPRCTLIVCSPALMQQWERELVEHVDPSVFKIVNRHYGKDRYNRKGAEYQMESADIIFTTYGEVVRSYPKCNLPPDIEEPAAKLEWWTKEWEASRGLLHRAHFYRVVMDEAQVIKNHASQTSIACRALMARHRWAISGTPIQNRLDELFPYFKFLRVRHTGTMPVFRYNFCLKDSDVCNKRLVSVLSGMMIRRSHDTELLGHRLVNLPENHQTTTVLQFNMIEREIYEHTRRRCIRAINAAGKDKRGEEQKRRLIIAMFQRLRQMVAHIFQTQEVIEQDEKLEYITKIKGGTETEKAMIDGISAMRLKYKERSHNQPLNAIYADVNTTADPNLTDLADDNHSGHATNERSAEQAENQKAKDKKAAELLVKKFAKHLRQVKAKSDWKELRERTLCQVCGGFADDPHVTSCFHLYCRECLVRIAIEAAQNDMDQTECHKCHHIYKQSAPCDGLKELEVRDLSASAYQLEKKKDDEDGPRKKPFKMTMDYVDHNDRLLLSTKIQAVKDELAKSLQEDPDRKIIVFSDWHMVMHLVGRVCQQEGWSCCHYNGRLSQEMREQNLSVFYSDPKVKILVASLKCGGTGLNLTAASKVICVDLWFNSYVEQQAFCRVHRIGQKKETFITRMVVAATVDEQLIELQETKKEIIGAALDDKEILDQLTLAELMKLFGTVKFDEDDKPFIMVDDEAEFGQKKARRANADVEKA